MVSSANIIVRLVCVPFAPNRNPARTPEQSDRPTVRTYNFELPSLSLPVFSQSHELIAFVGFQEARLLAGKFAGEFYRRSFTEGIETHKVDGIRLRVYSPEKTLADCFKYRNKLGLDTVLEALRLYRSRKRPNVDDLMKFARVCRVEKVMRPYLEAVL